MKRIQRRRGQSAVETMMLLPIVMMIFIAMYYLFTITFAAQNTHLRAREYVLHQDTYLGGRVQDTSGSAPWNGSDYEIAPAAEQPSFNFSASSRDRSIRGVSNSTQQLQAGAYLTSN